ncbi:MAG: hypothetical protein D4R64_15765 [Porphyromonadaceae bacterium]|nr:MAG: hypothetical protein D4R64_15765 [Porphyromonadaceae bacterium]
MEQEHFDPDFKELYDRYIREEQEEARKIYNEIAPELTLPARHIRRWWYPVAAAVLILTAGTWAVTSDQSPFRSKPKYTEAEVRQSLEKTIRALSIYSKTVREEFSRVEDLTAMTEAIKPGKRTPAIDPKSDSNTIKN